MLPDALVHFLGTQTDALMRTVGVGVLCVALQAARPAVAQPQLRPGIPTDFAHEIVGRVLNRLVTAPIALLLALTFATPPDTGAAGLPYVAGVALATLVSDFVGYWRHRMQHLPALWRFHAVHHSSRHLDWLSTSRFHPVDQGVTQLFHIVPLWVLGFPADVIAGTLLLRYVHGTLVHANVDLPLGPLAHVIVSPRFHRWHHSESHAGVNFATIFSFWDRAFGTAHVADAPPEATGLPGDPIPNDYAAQIVRPFLRDG